MVASFLRPLLVAIIYIPRILLLKLMEWYYSGHIEALPPIKDDCLLLPATELALKIRTGKIKSTNLVQACINRIEEINPMINCIIAKCYEEALKEAADVDELIAKGSKSPQQIEKETPFLGVPFTVKENIGLKNMPLTLGSLSRKDMKASKDAEVVKLMKKSGAIPIAVSNNCEMCMWWESKSKVFGATRNPYNSNHTPGGSSGGEGAAIGAGASPMGIGSDLGGSVRIPSYMCGIFGHKGSPYLVPYDAEYPLHTTDAQWRLNVRGPMTKFASDLRPIFKIMTQESKVDLKLEDPVNIKKLRYFYMDSDDDDSIFTLKERVHPEVKDAMKKVVEYFQTTYEIRVERVKLQEMKHVMEMWFARHAAETGVGVLPELGILGCIWEGVKALAGVSEHTVEYCVMAIMERFCTPPFGSDVHKQLLEMGEKLETKFQDLLKNDGVFFYPVQQTPPVIINTTSLRPANINYTMVFNLTGMPATAFPVTKSSKGLPIGLQVAAATNQDRLTMAVAEEMEKAFGGWTPPSHD